MSNLHINVRKRFIADETFDPALVKLIAVIFVLGDTFHVIFVFGILSRVQLYWRFLVKTQLLMSRNISHRFIEYLTPEQNMLHIVLLLAGSHIFEPSPKL